MAQFEMLSGWFGPGKSGATFTLQLDGNDVAALCRHFQCKPYVLGGLLTGRLGSFVGELIEKGSVGLEADRLEASGAIEVGRSMNDIHRCVRCGAELRLDREHVDTCGERCFKGQLAEHRASRA